MIFLGSLELWPLAADCIANIVRHQKEINQLTRNSRSGHQGGRLAVINRHMPAACEATRDAGTGISILKGQRAVDARRNARMEFSSPLPHFPSLAVPQTYSR